ncbi:MAG TPA: hypothetical protein VGP76_10155 [Planctomycetaceae bacterium]|jgi:hypothetical protein|nr:hypothetical protein [Planctomycetaceae bacterium]
MRYVAPILVAIILALGGDEALYAYAHRECPSRPRGCLGEPDSVTKAGEDGERNERDFLKACVLIVNGSALAAIFGTLIRRRRDRERLSVEDWSERRVAPLRGLFGIEPGRHSTG